MPNQFKFNSWVELNTTFDINLYETTFRGYDPQIGRFHQIDPLSGKFPEWSPYSFAFNNPIGLNDPMGAEPVDPKKWINSQLLSGKYGEFKRDKTGDSNIGELLGKLVEDINAKDLWGKEDIPSYEEFNDVVASFYEGKTLENYDVIGRKLDGTAVDDGRENVNNGGIGFGLSIASFGMGIYSDYIHDHNSYTTKGGDVKGIYKANGEYRSARASKFGQMSKFVKGLSVAGSVVTTAYSGYAVYEQLDQGGVNEVFKHRDIWDVGIGALGLGATGLAAFGIISNPIGWGIGIGVMIYGGATLIYDVLK